MLTIFNSLTKQKEEFRPIHPGKINIYVCGITVYDYCHIGHARSIIMFDIIVRYLRARGFEVNYVRNITDVDDKIIHRANANEEPVESLTKRFIDAMHEDERNLGVLPPDREPRATEYMPQMIAMIEKIIVKGFAYVADNGDVYFAVHKFKDYGKLSKRDLEKLKAGVRIEINDVKKDPLDFILWKLAKPGEPYWPSPWGDGRPGWHIECSTMSTDLLGQPFDIHGGGVDLKFPHHENEIAQAECCNNKAFANVWMHAGLLEINKEKMSKSLGNFVTIREALQKHHSEVIRYFMMSGHYRSPVNYSHENLQAIKKSLDTLYMALRDLSVDAAQEIPMSLNVYRNKFYQAMDDDFNTPVALSVLFDLAHETNRLKEQNQVGKATELAALLKELSGIFGILQTNPEEFLRGDLTGGEVIKIEQLIAARDLARNERNWNEADRLRDELKAMGIAIEDNAQGTTWRRV